MGAADVDGAAGSAPGIGAPLPVLLTLEDRKHVGESPTLGSILRPPVVIPFHTAHPHHGIDAGAATKYVAEGHIEFAIVQSWRGGNRQVVVERAADIVKPDAWVQDGRRVVRSSGLDDEDLRAGGGQFGGKNRTGRACSHHDEVVATLDFFIRCVDHCWISQCLKAEFHHGKIFAKGLIQD